MTYRGIHFQLLLPSASDLLSQQPVGKLHPVTIHASETAPFTALDSFDHALCRSGRLLLESEGCLELLRDNAPAITATSEAPPRFLSDFTPGPFKRGLAGLSPLRRLLPIGAGTRQRVTLAFADDEGKTHCRAHLLKFETDEGRSLALVELQGIKGYAKSLRLLRTHIERLGGALSSCGALYGQLFPTLASYDPKPEILIRSDETAFQAASKIIASGLPILRANEPGIIADHDTEFLHDYRVQIRKIRSVLSLFKGVYDDSQTVTLKARFSALAAPTGRLRDLDVYLLNRSDYRELLPESLRPGLESLFDIFAAQRAEEQLALARHLRSSRYKREIAALEKLFRKPGNLRAGERADQSAHDYACESIWQHYRKVRKAAVQIGPQTPDEDIHDLRIRCKKLRYLMEFFAPVFPAPALNKLLKSLKALQENLGLFNDYSVQQDKLKSFLHEAPADQAPPSLAVAQSVGALIAVLHGMQLDERSRIMDKIERFNRPGIQQTFSDLFQPLKEEQ